jgi:hypothetical protein
MEGSDGSEDAEAVSWEVNSRRPAAEFCLEIWGGEEERGVVAAMDELLEVESELCEARVLLDFLGRWDCIKRRGFLI